MSRVATIINDVQARLADEREIHWTRTRLLFLLSQAQIKIAHETRVLTKRISLGVLKGVREYKLPDDVDQLLRAHGDSGSIEFRSHSEMDEREPSWEKRTGKTVEKLIYDMLTPARLIVYPIPAESDNAELYTFEAGDPTVMAGGELLGAVAGISGLSSSSPFGEVTDIYVPGTNTVFSSQFGVVTRIEDVVANLELQYSRRPVELLTEDAELELSQHYNLALTLLTCFYALDADHSAGSKQNADRYLAMYNDEMRVLKSNKAHNQTRGTNHRDVQRSYF